MIATIMTPTKLSSSQSNISRGTENNITDPAGSVSVPQHQLRHELIQQLLAFRQHLPVAIVSSAARPSSPSFSLTPLETSIIQALQQKQQLHGVAATDTRASTAPSTIAIHSNRASNNSTPIINMNQRQPVSESPSTVATTITTPTMSALALYSHSRPYDTQLSLEEKEILNQPFLSASTSPSSTAASSDDSKPTDMDVLLGRGGKTNMHPGNMKFRQAVHDRQELYRRVPKYDKIWIAQNVVAKIQESGGRFMRQEGADKKWVEVPLKKATEKASQALRERERENRSPFQFQKAKSKVVVLSQVKRNQG